MNSAPKFFIFLSTMAILLLTNAGIECENNKRSGRVGKKLPETCRTNGHDICNVSSDIDFPSLLQPRNETEFKEFCSDAINKYMPCYILWAEECEFFRVPRYRMYLDFCVEDSALYKGMEENIECIYKESHIHEEGNTPCKKRFLPILRNELEMFSENNRSKHFPDMTKKDMYMIKLLLEQSHELGCFLCRSECLHAEDLIVELMARDRGLFWEPFKLYKYKALEILEYLDLEDRQKNWIKEGAEKYVKKCEVINCTNYDIKYP